MASFLACIRPSITALPLSPSAAGIAADGVALQWYGQSATRLTAPDGRIIVIDPFIRGNPVPLDRERDLKRPGGVDPILDTHARGDHFGDTGVDSSAWNRATAGNATDGRRPGQASAANQARDWQRDS